MATNSTTLDAAHARSYAILEAARQKAAKQDKYDSTVHRKKLSEGLRERFGSEPHAWQVDCSEAVHLGLDCVVIAGTGSGKTMPFVMPLILDEKKRAIVISPLKLLQQDQAERFEKLRVLAAAVNGDTWSEVLRKDIETGRYQGILASPEMCLKHPGLRKLLIESGFIGISAVYIDEAHCIAQWGGDFRAAYAELNKLRAFFPPHIPFYATSATLAKDALSEVRASLGIDASSSFFLNLGNDRPNLSYEVHKMKSAKDYDALQPHLFRNNNTFTSSDVYKSIVFTNSVLSTQIATRKIRMWLPRHLRKHVAFLHAHRSPREKRRIMRHFRQGRIKILVATEAAGMGADIPDVERVIHFGVPSSLSVWIQRAGRAGRSQEIDAQAILLAEQSVWEKKKKKRKKTDPSDPEAPENADDGEADDAEVDELEDDAPESEVIAVESNVNDNTSLEWAKNAHQAHHRASHRKWALAWS